MLVKNTYGISYVLSPKVANYGKMDQYGGSSLDRKKTTKKKADPKKRTSKDFGQDESNSKEGQKKIKLRSLSHRSKGKIRGKLISFARLHKKLSFVTLTFCNAVEDQLAVIILATFLKNVTKQAKDFQYLWVAEKQTENEVFKDNIHFHLITNLYWDIKKWWQYWVDLQAKYGIVPRDVNYKPSSAFDVKHVRSNNIKGMVNYLTKYVTKNKGKFSCQVWNCSRKISWLYTSFYSDLAFIEELKRLEAAGQLGGKIQVYPKEYCNINIIPLNRTTSNFYNRIDDRNRIIWNGVNEKEVGND